MAVIDVEALRAISCAVAFRALIIRALSSSSGWGWL